jgi:hypothetical protein
LAQLRERVQLLNSDDEYVWLELSLRKWEKETIAELKTYAARSDASWFEVLGEFRARAFHGTSAEINHEKSMLGERLERLVVIIRRERRGIDADRLYLDAAYVAAVA